MKILVVEDTDDLLNNIISYLAKEGYYCKGVGTADLALDELISQEFDVVILDIMLPDNSGLNVLKEIKRMNIQPAVIIISARNALDDKLTGLNLGADDYLTKPFHLSELHARIKAVHRRNKALEGERIVLNEITIDTQTLEVFVNDQVLTLTKKEYELLNYFITNKARVLTKQAIAEYLWGSEVDVYDSFDFVYQHIKNLRKKISEAGGKDYIRTIYGMGYKFNVATS